MFKFLGIDRSVVATLAGYAIEKYDMFLYGFFTILIGDLFFPDYFMTASRAMSIIFGLGIFAAGYVLRPVGGVFFGHLGDRFGRKKALLVSLCLSSISPFILGILPTYNHIGIVAPICLLICRLFQGFCSGGELSGASVFLEEHSAENKVAFSASLLRSVGFFGVAFGTIVAYLSTLPLMPHWGWRIPFLVGALLTIVLYFVRLKYMVETSSFQKIEKSGKVVSFPLAEILKNSKSRLACAIALTVYASTAYYMSTIYTGSVLKTAFNLQNYQIMAINTGFVLFLAFTTPFFGLWADRLGLRKFLLKSLWWNILLAYPLFWLMKNHFSLKNFICFQAIFGLLCASFYAPFVGLLPKLFRVEERYSGVALSITLVQAVLGGLTPLISALLVYLTGDKAAPALFLIGGAMVAILGIKKVEDLFPEAKARSRFKTGEENHGASLLSVSNDQYKHFPQVRSKVI
jgi:MHS family proline/betaine transporter-like MFS transporter